jgi:hypothetical protein
MLLESLILYAIDRIKFYDVQWEERCRDKPKMANIKAPFHLSLG